MIKIDFKKLNTLSLEKRLQILIEIFDYLDCFLNVKEQLPEYLKKYIKGN